jgi:hypothetical protein
MGPFLDLTVRRSQLSSSDLMKAACQRATNTAKAPKIKNVERTSLGEKLGRIHMVPQNLDKMAVRRVSALRDRKKAPSSSAKLGGGDASGNGTGSGSKRAASSSSSTEGSRKRTKANL